MGCNKYNEKTLGVSEIMKNINPKYVKLLQKSYEKYQHIDSVTTGNVVQEIGSSADIKINLNLSASNLISPAELNL